MFGHNPAESGIDVDEDTALNFSAYWRGVNLLSSSIAMLGKHPYRETGEGRVLATEHPSYDVLVNQPNPEMTPVVFDETLQAHVLTWGNGYAEIERAGSDPADPVIALWPLLPNQIWPERDGAKLVYRFYPRFEGEKEETFQAHEVLHVPGLGFDGLRGYGVVQRAREGVGLGLATERSGAALFGRGSVPGGVIEVPGEMSEPAQKNLRESWEQLHRGPDNAHRVAILEQGTKFNPIGMSNEDAQYLATRQFQVVEIARWIGVPPHMLYELSASTNNNIEHQGLEFLTYSLLPWLIKWRQEYKRKLFTAEEQRSHIVDYNVEVLLKTDIKTRYEAYTQGRNGGWLTLNDILRRENMNPLTGPEGSSRLMPSTMLVMGDHVKGLGGETADVAQIKDTALDGGQVTSLLTIMQAVAANQLAPDSAAAMIGAAFPSFDPRTVVQLLAPYRKAV